MSDHQLSGKKLILGISGSIAAYKAANLVRLFIKAGCEVKVLMTEAATAFISPLTLSTLSKQEVHTSVIDSESWNNHVELGLWADHYVIAPGTANTIAKLAHGICDNILAAVYLSARCRVSIAPAMDLDMWQHPSTQRNIKQIEADGTTIIPVGDGELASGLYGKGRMAEPEEIFDFVAQEIGGTTARAEYLTGKRVMVTAGPTYEAIDPVRFIGNRSSGKMGIALANALARRGAEVDLILGPSSLSIQHPKVNTIRVESAADMYEAAMGIYPKTDAAILAAAVADYTIANPSDIKMKKQNGSALTLELAETVDIAKTLGEIKDNGKILVGFALETNNEIEHAKRKIKKKNFDFIVLNSLNDKGAGFQHDTNKITIIHKDNNLQEFELKSKQAVAEDIVDALEKLLLKK